MTSVKEVAEQDIERVSEIMCNCYRWLDEHEGYTKEQTDFLVLKRGSVETIKAESQNQLYLVAFIQDNIIGMVAVKDNEIAKLYVDPEYHKQGIGAILFNAAEKAVVEAGYKKLIAGAMAISAVGFYKKMSMTITGQKILKTGGCSGRKIVLMEKALNNPQDQNPA